MPSSNISTFSSRPIVKHLIRQDLRSIYSDKNSSCGRPSPIHIQRNRIFPNIEDSWVNTTRSPETFEQPQKQSLFRRVYYLLGIGVILVLISVTIGAIVILLLQHMQSNGSSQSAKTTDTTTNLPVGSTSSISSSNVTNSTIIMASSTTSVMTSTTTSGSLMLRWNSTGSTVAGITSSNGAAMNQLDRPFGLALDSSNTIYIADQQNNRIQKWPLGASTGTTIAGQSSGTFGTTSTDFDQPSGIILDSSNNIYVTDTTNNRVQFWSNGASSGTTVAGVLGSAGSGNNELAAPFGIARDSNSGTLYIVDQSNHRVMSYLVNASSGTVAAGGNGQGTSNTQLYLPVGLYFDSSSNSLYIANAGANNIVRWVVGATSWTLVAGNILGTSGSTSTLLNYPMDVTLDSMGNVYVADRNNHRIQLFLTGQTNGTTIAGKTSIASANSTLLYNPCSVVLDAQFNLYVADTYNDRVQKFLRY